MGGWGANSKIGAYLRLGANLSTYGINMVVAKDLNVGVGTKSRQTTDVTYILL